MRKKLSRILLGLLVLTAVFLPLHAMCAFKAKDTGSLSTTAPGIPNIKIYRLYFSANGEHLYTTSYEEVKNLVNNHGWTDEGIGWYAPRNGQAVYRLFNEKLGNHLYTTDENEVSVLTSQQGWVKDFNGQPIFYSGGDQPIYRLYNGKLNGMHHLTTDENEYNTLPGSGWDQEGVALHATTQTSDQEYPIGSADISNVPSEFAIQADVNLSGSGSGYHAKLVASSGTSAVSFGTQYDSQGVAPYQDSTTFLIENVANNNAGGQNYQRTGYSAQNQTFRLLLAVGKDGTCDVYVNGNKAGSVKNSGLANQKDLGLNVEGSARLNGDSVNAAFSNIKVKKQGNYDENFEWKPVVTNTNPGITSDTSQFKSNRSVTIHGTIQGLSSSEDWDNKYGSVSGIVQFSK